MTITTTFSPPLPSDSPVAFNVKAFTLLGDLNGWSAEANALAVAVSQDESALAASVLAASGSAATATTKAGESAANADTASTQAGIATTQSGVSVTKAGEANSSAIAAAASAASVSKDSSGGVAGLTLFKLNLRNAAGSITSWITNAATVARTWTMPDKDGMVAMTSDITGGTSAGSFTTLSASGALTTSGLKEDASGNLGLGVVPSVHSTVRTLQVGATTYLYGDGVANDWSSGLSNNAAPTGGGSHKHTGGQPAASYEQRNGWHFWKSAGTESPGTAVAWASPMALDAVGNLSNTGSHTIGSFTSATRPTHAAGKMIYVSDGGGGAVFQGSNGSAWVNLG